MNNVHNNVKVLVWIIKTVVWFDAPTNQELS